MPKFKVFLSIFFNISKERNSSLFFSFFKVSGRSIEEILIVLLPYFLVDFLIAKLI